VDEGTGCGVGEMDGSGAAEVCVEVTEMGGPAGSPGGVAVELVLLQEAINRMSKHKKFDLRDIELSIDLWTIFAVEVFHEC